MEAFAEFGYLGLFVSSFLAATILPLSSEAVLGLLLSFGMNPALLIGVATAGNVLGALTNYALGFWGGTTLVRRVLKIEEEEIAKSRERFNRYGIFSLLFSWLPVIGDPLTVVAGTAKTNIVLFLILVTSGKLARYIATAYAFAIYNS